MNRSSLFDSNSLTVRALAVGVLTMLMLIPVGMVGSVVAERHAFYQNVVQQIGTEWGGPQTVTGPVLLIPFTQRWTTTETVVTDDGDVKEIRREHSRNDVLTVLPSALSVRATVDAERRNRSIYEAMVYATDVAMTGRFAPPDWTAGAREGRDVHWDEGVLALGVSAPLGIRSAELTGIPGGVGTPEPGTPSALLPQGMHWQLDDAEAVTTGGEFELKLALRGSEQIDFAPVGGTTDVAIASAWPHPSFTGILPSERDVRADGFQATWSVSSLSRSYPQVFDQARAPASLHELGVGVRLVQPVFLHSLADRAVKYAVLFITLTFVTLLVFELVTDVRVHYVQYGLIGAAIALFYLLLLALSEHLGFGVAYLIAAGTLVLMITAYAAAALGAWSRALWVGLLQAVTYSVLYVILRLEDYALLTGTCALLVALATIMYFTRSLSRQDAALSTAQPAV